MRDFQQKRGWRRVLQSPPVLVILGFLLIFFAWGVIGFYNKMELTIENRKLAENKFSQMEKQKEKLSSDISTLSTASGTEESIREKFGLAKEGEGMIVVVDDKNAQTAQSGDSGGFFSFFSSLFFWKKWFK